MIAFGHTAVGAIVGVTAYHYLGSGNPATGLIITGAAGIAAHYLADLIPHGHFFGNKEFKSKILADIILDLYISIALFLLIFYFRDGLGIKFFYILFAIGGSQLPDVIDGLIYIGLLPKTGLLRFEHKLHLLTHWHGIFKDGKLVDGQPISPRDIWQLIVVASSLFLVFYIR